MEQNFLEFWLFFLIKKIFLVLYVYEYFACMYMCTYVCLVPIDTRRLRTENKTQVLCKRNKYSDS